MKRVLVIVVVILLLCCGGLVAGAFWVLGGAKVDTFGKVDFANRLAVPPLASSRLDEQGRRVFELNTQEGVHEFGSGRVSPTWGFNGDYLGPTLRAKRGEQVLVNVRNGLSESTTVHWHGMHLPPAMDGGPHQQVGAGATWAPQWSVNQPAATLWYHPHQHGETASHVYRGLAGMFIVDDDESSGLALPHTYGVDDIPLVVQDKKFEGDNDELDDSSNFLSDMGILGDEIVVNGTHSPFLDVSTSLVRLRILNASNARSFDFGFADDRDFALVGTDGGLLPAPAAMRRIQLAAGERAEVVVSLTPGETVVLRSYPPDLGGGIERLYGGDDQFDVLQLRAAARLSPSPSLPQQLVSLQRLDPASASVTRKFRLAGHAINGKGMEMDRVDFAATVDTTEIWEVFNNDGNPHSFHVHDVQFQVVSLNGAAPPPHLRGWKDTVAVPADTHLRLIMRFADFSDPNVPYMYHCHVLYHEDAGMMGQFAVVRPGEKAGSPMSHSHAHH